MASWQDLRTRTRVLTTRYLENPLAVALSKIGLTANRVTMLGLLVSAGTAYWISEGNFLSGGILLLFAAMMDMADGALARRFGTASPRGALLDSAIDRVAEAVVFLGLLVYYVDPLSIPEVVLINLALIGSFMVSYLRARGEGLGIDCKVGNNDQAGESAGPGGGPDSGPGDDCPGNHRRAGRIHVPAPLHTHLPRSAEGVACLR